MSSTPHISVVIPLYYCDTDLFLPINNCLFALQDHYPEFELIVIDDYSPLEPYHQWPITSSNSENLGFTATVNRGMSLASGDIIIVLNDDITIQAGQLDRYLHLDPLTPTIASPADTASSDNDLFGACWGITRSAYDLLGPLNETYKNFFSDLDYYERAKAQGVTIIKWEDIVLEHPESSTFKLLDKESLLREDAKRYHTK